MVCEKPEDGQTGNIALSCTHNFEAATLQCHLSEMTAQDVWLTADSFSSTNHCRVKSILNL